jgi:endonuclease YncB( thermonuclease family)
MIRILLVLLISLPGWASADVYQWQDTSGKTHFSDRSYAVDAQVKKLDINPGVDFFRVKTVYDGDTVVLEDGRKIRLLGINTPEVQHRDKQADAGGDDAKRWLQNKLQSARVRLELSTEKTDKYGRTLAHLFTDKKDHINLQLVAAGLAAVSIYPQNLLYVSELVRAEEQAEKAHLGIWQQAQYQPIPVASLTEDGHSGWTRVVGKVLNVKTTGKSVYLEFAGGNFRARIEKEWLDLYPDINEYRGKTLEVRGWLNKNKGTLSMLIRHPSAIKIR